LQHSAASGLSPSSGSSEASRMRESVGPEDAPAQIPKCKRTNNWWCWKAPLV